jgi:hypothetical protein
METVYRDIVLKCNGDLKNAINQLYIYSLRPPSQSSKSKKKPSQMFTQSSFSMESVPEAEGEEE